MSSLDPVAAQGVEAALSLSDEQRQATRFWLTVLGVLGTGSLIGVAFSLYLVNHAPLLLIALSPLGRHLVLVAPIVDPMAFMVVSVGRRLLFYLASFQLGRALGPVGIPWIEARAARFGQFVRFVERLFARAPHAVVLTMTGPTVAALAGISGMRLAAFVPLATLSLAVRMLVTIYFAEWMREYIEIALVWIDEYWLPGTILMVTGVAVTRWRRRTPLSVMED